MAIDLYGEVLIDGAAEGLLFRMAKPISFWGGVDPATGRVSACRCRPRPLR